MLTRYGKLRVRAPFSSLEEHEVFAVQATRAQFCIRPNGEYGVLRIAGQTIEAKATDGVAVFWVEGLHPDTTYVANIEDQSGMSLGMLSVTTLPELRGPTSKFATISDVHLGANDFANQHSMSEPPDAKNPFALRCAAAAIAEAVEWGAEMLLIKGDLTDSGSEDDWDLAYRLLDDVPIPILATWGNHDVWTTRDLDPEEIAGTLGLSPDPIVTAELDQVQIVLADTSIPNRGRGDLEQHRETLLGLVDVNKPVFLGIHHNIMRTPKPWFIPHGIPSTNAAPFLAELPDANKNVFISAGHTHRNRRHTLGARGDITFTEVSATADYPGAWAGYEVSADIIRQTVQRTASASALEWSEQVRGAVGGIWPRWSQGLLDDRCVDMTIR